MSKLNKQAENENCTECFYSIHSWMRSNLNIDNLTEAAIYAIIYGYYLQSKQFYGELKYLQEQCFCKESSVTKYLNSLLSKGLITKTKIYTNGYIQRYSYSVVENKIPLKYRNNVRRPYVASVNSYNKLTKERHVALCEDIVY